MKLDGSALSHLPKGVVGPTYDRSNLGPGIIHIGLGNFHRAHQAWYLHRLMQQGLAQDWAILGAGVRPYDQAQREKLLAQDCLTTLIELDPAGISAEVSGSMVGYVEIKDGNGPLIEAMADPRIRIVSLTVTEGGYYIDPASGGLDTSHEDIQQDARTPDRPCTAFGAMVAALKLRRDRGHGPFTGQSCDNLQDNGGVLRRTVVDLARMTDPYLADWIDAHTSFPNSMVDCIVPATGPKELALVQGFGIEDAVPVTHENFRQWVIEDNFCAGRPDWDMVGATFTTDVHTFEAMKIRLLNGGHQIIANPGEILSVATIAGCMEHPLIGPLFRKVARQEIVPHVQPVPGMSPEAYVDLIDSRFSNPRIVDTTRRVAFDGSSRHTGFLIPVILDALTRGTPIEGLALAEALWARMCEGTREDGTRIDPNDPTWDSLHTAAKAARTDPDAWLQQPAIYGELAGRNPFADSFRRWLPRIWSGGAGAAIQAYLDA
ncbi:MAG: mannitol dehydrogenase family protein [Pseudomonadota bacterium]